ALLSGCAPYTMLSHPEVEVYDERLEKYIFEEVTLASNCRSCHANQPSKFDVYRHLSRTSGSITSIERIDLLQVRAIPELRGYENYLHSDLGSYYYAAWWFNPVIVESGFYGTSTSPAAQSTPERIRQSYRRSFGRAMQSSAPHSGAQPAASPPSSPASAATAVSGAQSSAPSSSGPHTRSSSEAGSTSQDNQGSRQNSGEAKSESTPRSSGRIRE
ncbi:MAG: hypothetical protein ACK424_05170, partial [Candidatus Thermochlorobacter sp.]